MVDSMRHETDPLSEWSRAEVNQATCSHDAPDQQPGVACIRCGKILPGGHEMPAPTLTSHIPLPKSVRKDKDETE